MDDGAAVDHAGLLRRGVGCDVELPDLQALLVAIEANRVHDALEVAGVHRVASDGGRGEQRRLRFVDPAALTVRQLEGADLAVGRGDDGGPVGDGRTRGDAAGDRLVPLFLTVGEVISGDEAFGA